MGADEETGPANGSEGPKANADRITQATSVAVVAAALVVWWPAFDLGAYGVIFFQQLLALWAASTAIFLVSLTAGRRARVSWPRRLALLLPSLWLLLAIVLPEVGVRTWSRALFYVAIVLTLAGMPFLAALLLRVTIAGYEQIPNRRRLLAAAIVGIVAITSFGLGKFNGRFLTCNDFVISGNDTPPSCSQGHGHLGNR
ncbi:MAG TPA: hypothetical protein VHR39_17600 [Propionibacteriaceae bacterium]|jgi:hypothetical protein|nr:hypothetical protein [Propionibacteriaceae bacterium]